MQVEQRPHTLSLDLRAAYEAGKLAARFDRLRSERFRPMNGRWAVVKPAETSPEREDGWHH